MFAIVMEGLLFVALVAACGALLYFAVLELTPLGRRRQQVQNRKEIERVAELTCPVHGLQREDAMVRLPSGEKVCPHCFKETVWQVR